MVKACCVPGCKSGVNVPSHKFPKNAQRCFQWIESLKLHALKNYCAHELQKYKVCHKHFLEKDYSCSLHNRVLLNTAIPVVEENSIDMMDSNVQHEQSLQENKNINRNQVSQPSHTEDMLLHRITHIEKNMEEHNKLLVLHQELLMQNNVNQLVLQNQIFEQEIQSLQTESYNEDIIHNNSNALQNEHEEQSSIVCKSIKRRPNLQNITRVANLSPKAKSLYNVGIKLRRKNKYLKRLVKKCRDEKNTRSISLAHKNSTTAVREKFINMILRNNDVPAQGRRYTTEDKIFCIGLYKRSRVAYTFLSKYLYCPSITTLNSQLSDIPMQAGYTRLIIKYLRQIVKNMKDNRERYVALIWDEISLQPALFYNKKQNKIIGFEDWGMRRTRKIADHAIVFFIRCLKSGNKMPLGYGFCDSTTKSYQLIRCVKEWLLNISASGLIPVATICDQGGSNIGTINSFIDETNKIRIKRNLRTENSFIIKNHKIIPVFDYVHLLKGIRNNLLVKDLDTDTSIKSIPQKKCASWEDIIKTYEIDKNSFMKYCQMEKITDKHIIPKLIPKMRVKYASEIFSRTVSNFMDVILNLNGGLVQTQQGEIILPKSASTTCEFIRFVNDLFDSFNGKNGQGLSSVITSTSGHTSFWQEACNKLKKMCFVEKETRKISTKNAPKCLRNWVWTIEAAQEIWNMLHEANFESFNLKFLNQDVIENFFSQIRSNGCTNRNPSCEQFEGAFKTLLICNLTSKHSIGANCEKDTEGMTYAFSHLINLSEINKETSNNSEEIDEVECIQPAIPCTTTTEKIINEEKIVNIMKRNKIIAQCEECTNNVKDAQILFDIKQAIEILELQFTEICYEVKLLEKTMKILEDRCFLSCSLQCTHLKEAAIKITAEEFIKAWCKFINNILCRKINIDSENFMYKIAKRLSTKYIKKTNDTKLETSL